MSNLRKRLKRLTRTKSSGQQIRARAEARCRAIEVNDRRPPNVSVVFVSLEKKECDSKRATLGDREWIRQPDESLHAFQERVHNALPVGGSSKLVICWPSE